MKLIGALMLLIPIGSLWIWSAWDNYKRSPSATLTVLGLIIYFITALFLVMR